MKKKGPEVNSGESSRLRRVRRVSVLSGSRENHKEDKGCNCILPLLWRTRHGEEQQQQVAKIVMRRELKQLEKKEKGC